MSTGPNTGFEIMCRGVRTKKLNPVFRSAKSHCDIVPTLCLCRKINDGTAFNKRLDRIADKPGSR